MRSDRLAALRRLPPLGDSTPAAGATRCKICGAAAIPFDTVDFNKVCADDYYRFGLAGIPVLYHRCQSCQFIFTQFCDDWTAADFAECIYNRDYPLVDGDYAMVRPVLMADAMRTLLADHRSDRILDYGSGSGSFAERLREAGFSRVESYDPFTSPQRPVGEFDIVTCFETIEHAPFPAAMVAELRGFMQPAGCILFSTSLPPANIDELRANWWYIAPRNGHVSIYTLAALERLAADAGLELYAGDGCFAFAAAVPSPRAAALLRRVGPSRRSVRLTAPAPGSAGASPEEAWHAVERFGAIPFRWTGASRVEWQLPRLPQRYPCRLAVTIPFVMEIVPGFADRCRLEIGSQVQPLERHGAALAATIDLVQAPGGPLALITPAPQRPADLHSAPDQRPLGLAVPLAPDAA